MFRIFGVIEKFPFGTASIDSLHASFPEVRLPPYGTNPFRIQKDTTSSLTIDAGPELFNNAVFLVADISKVYPIQT